MHTTTRVLAPATGTFPFRKSISRAEKKRSRDGILIEFRSAFPPCKKKPAAEDYAIDGR